MKLLIVAGGGGHFSPALSVIKVLPKDTKLLLVGRKHAFEGDDAESFEYQTSKKLAIPFRAITTARLQRKLTRHTLVSFLKFPGGILEALHILRDFKPDVVLSFGGYVALPITLASFLLKIPLVIHEQTLEIGIANKIASYFSKKICISWETSMPFFPKTKTVLTGNPIREEIISSFHTKVLEKTKFPLLYITGGSLGSHALNVLVEGCMVDLLKDYIVVHQTGAANQSSDYKRLVALRETFDPQMQKKYFVNEFFSPQVVGGILSQADLVVSRSGMTTVSELLFFGVPTLFIPLPFSQKNEQLKNAEFFTKTGLGEVLEQKGLTSEILYTKIVFMLSNIEHYKKNREQARSLIKTDSADKILQIITSVYHEQSKKKTNLS